VPSRAADHLFWLGRYTERLEQLLRVLGCALGRASGETASENLPELRALARLSANLGLIAPGIDPGPAPTDLLPRMLHLLYDPDEPGAVRDLLKRIRFIAFAVRDRFSGDTWRILGRLDSDGRSTPGALRFAGATALIHNLILDLAAFNGMEMENMTRGRGWRFLDFGRRLERGLSVTNLLMAAAKVETQTAEVLDPVLEIADSAMTYRRLYYAAPRWSSVLGLLLRDESNPRSLAFQINVLRTHATALIDDTGAVTPEAGHAQTRNLTTQIRAANLNEVAALHARGERHILLNLLRDWSGELTSLSDQVTKKYFSHSVPRVS
jgi:uncharacterized alpha-E superfamily protein